MTSSPASPPKAVPHYLLDTNIVVHYARGKTVGQQIESDYQLLKTPYRPLICIVTVGESLAFATKRGWGSPKIDALKQILSQFVVVDINQQQILDAYANIDCQSQKPMGRKMGKNDLWIAAVAHVSHSTLMTTDSDFDHLNGKWLTVVKIDQHSGRTI